MEQRIPAAGARAPVRCQTLSQCQLLNARVEQVAPAARESFRCPSKVPVCAMRPPTTEPVVVSRRVPGLSGLRLDRATSIHAYALACYVPYQLTNRTQGGTQRFPPRHTPNPCRPGRTRRPRSIDMTQGVISTGGCGKTAAWAGAWNSVCLDTQGWSLPGTAHDA